MVKAVCLVSESMLKATNIKFSYNLIFYVFQKSVMFSQSILTLTRPQLAIQWKPQRETGALPVCPTSQITIRFWLAISRAAVSAHRPTYMDVKAAEM
jgi:hypothetical protein